MKSVSIMSGMFLALLLPGTAIAQDSQPAPQSVVRIDDATVPVVKPAEKLILKEGADVSLKFAQDLSSKTVAEDDPVNLVLAEDLKLGDLVIAKAGAKAVGTITHSKRAGMIGKGGELNMRLQYLLVGDSRLKLRGTKGKEGQDKEGTAVALTVLFGPIGLIKHGKEVQIKEGTPLQAFTDENYEVPVSK
jgi:hypothetical protein